MNNWMEIIKGIPELFIYFALGYAFIKTYEYVAWKCEDSKLEHIVFRSIIGSYVIKTTFDILTKYYFTSSILYIPILIFVAVVSGYCFGRFFRSNLFDYFQRKLKINRNKNKNIWNDIFARKDVWFRVQLKGNEGSYIGLVEFCEENVRDPMLILTRYQLLDGNGKVVVDNSENFKEKIVLDMKDFETAQLIEISEQHISRSNFLDYNIKDKPKPMNNLQTRSLKDIIKK